MFDKKHKNSSNKLVVSNSRYYLNKNVDFYWKNELFAIYFWFFEYHYYFNMFYIKSASNYKSFKSEKCKRNQFGELVNGIV